jgi:hypothetical protein
MRWSGSTARLPPCRTRSTPLRRAGTARARDAGGDFRLSTADGQPAYGPIAVSLTTKGNTSDASALAVDRMPVANSSGNYFYYRTGIRVVASATETAADIAQAIRMGQGVVVVHGVDYNGNGKYDMEGAGASELNPALPAEATDPLPAASSATSGPARKSVGGQVQVLGSLR